MATGLRSLLRFLCAVGLVPSGDSQQARGHQHQRAYELQMVAAICSS